jgi:hypothetical protein
MATTATVSRPGTMWGRSPGHRELRAFSGKDPVTGEPRQATRTFVGGERAAAIGPTCGGGGEGEVQSDVGDRGPAARQVARGHGVQPAPSDGLREQAEGRSPYSPGPRSDALDAAYRGWLAEGLSPATVHKYHSILSAACRQAVKWGWIDAAPTARATPPSMSRMEVQAPTPEQLSELVKVAEVTDPVLATAIALARTGARRGELVHSDGPMLT